VGGQIWVSAAGLETGAATVDALAQDIANVNTPGFKSLLPVPGEAAPQAVYAAGFTAGPVAPAQVLAGGGVSPLAEDVDWAQGSLAETGDPLDLALLGPGLFMLRGASGATVYTRSGAFGLDAAGHLTDAEGRLLLDAQGQPLTLPRGATAPQVGPDGTVTAIPAGGGAAVTVGRIGLALPEAPQGMAASGSVWTAPGTAGRVAVTAPDGSSTRVVSGALEQSNADLASLLPRLAEAQQAYALNARAVTIGLSLWQTDNQLLG
jgi:flagellar basal body rod protein FlgG